jgi:hemolysin activation/secretion protein
VGYANLVVDTTQPRAVADLQADNRAGKYLGPEHYTARLALNSVLGLQDSTMFEYVSAAPSSRFRSWTIGHAERLSTSGLTLNVSYTDYRSQPNLGPKFVGFNLETNSKTAYADLSYPIIRSRATNLRVRGGFRYHNGDTDSSFLVNMTKDKLSDVLFGITMDHADGWHGVSTLDMELSKGVNALGASRPDDINLSRPGGLPDAAKATLYLGRLQDLSHEFSLLLAVNGQYAASRLLLPDEFAYGGEFFGRAYDAAEFVGDSGLAGKLDLRYTWQGARGFALMPYAFYEAGWVSRRLDAADTVSKKESALSAGGGLRVTAGRYLSGYAEVAKPINHGVAAEGNQKTRVFVGVKASFQ